MGNIAYVKGDILRVKDEPRILIHSCNCNGSWGGGIAYQLGLVHPQSETEYIRICAENGDKLLGTCKLIDSYNNSTLIIACLFTASFGGSAQDSARILRYTESALLDLDKQLNANAKLRNYKFIMPKINSGIFGVPWEETESILQKLNRDFTVYVY